MIRAGARLAIPPITEEDRLPHGRAVWRDDRPPTDAEGHRQVCVDYGDDTIARTYVGSVPDWGRVVRWRWGWPPR